MHNDGVNDPQDKRMTLPTVSSLTIRPCEETDIPAITEIYRDAVLHGRASFEIDPPTVETMAERRCLLVEGNYPYLVADVGGKVAGYAYAGAYRARPAYGAAVENSVYVDPAMKGMGIGRKLLDALIADATVSHICVYDKKTKAVELGSELAGDTLKVEIPGSTKP